MRQLRGWGCYGAAPAKLGLGCASYGTRIGFKCNATSQVRCTWPITKRPASVSGRLATTPFDWELETQTSLSRLLVRPAPAYPP